MRTTTRALLCTALLTVVCALPAAAGAPEEPTPVSGPSPLPEQGCGQVDPRLDPLATGDVAGFAGQPLYDAQRGVEQDLSLVADPRDPRRLTAAWAQDSAAGFVVARSEDGGRTWTSAPVPGLTVCGGGSAQHVLHARLAQGPDGRLWLAGETLDGFFPDPRSGVNRIPVVTSTDGGQTWSSPVFVDAVPAANGFDTLAADPELPGTAYVAWHVPEPVATSYVSRTVDGGRTWTRSTVPGGPPDSLPSQRVVARGGGALVLVTNEETLRGFLGGAAGGVPLVVRRSPDGGATWSAPQPLAAAAPGQWAAAVAGPRGRVHVAWYGAPDACGRPLLARTSVDGGTSWGATSTVLSCVVGPGTDAAVTPDGTVGVPVTVAAGDAGRQVLATSSDDGASWQVEALTPPFPLPPAAGFFSGAAAGPSGFSSLFLRGGGDPTDVVLARSPGR